jgi:large subunit ribosomal protein L15
MKLHDLRPAEGSRKERTRVGRGIAAGKGKTAGRGTKGQKSRSGGSIPPWFEGGQTPLHMRIPKLRGFRNPFKTEYEVVNVGAIQAAVDRGAFEAPSGARATGDDRLTINQDVLRAAGLVRKLDKPLKILGNGDLSASLFVVADAFTASARTKIEAAGGSVNVLEVPDRAMPAIGVDDAPAEATEATPEAAEQLAEAPAAAPAKRRTKKAEAAADSDAETGATASTDDDAPLAASDDASTDES